MILKVTKYKKTKETEMKEIVSFHECENFTNDYTYIKTNKNEMISSSNYSVYDPILNDFIEYEIQNIYVMNNEGKTIERLV